MASGEHLHDNTPMENVCPICMEEFKRPKLLLCRHTFCASCLDNLVATKNEKTKFPCPICRNQVKLSKSGVDGLLSNYFVACAPDMQRCNICNSDSEGKLLRCDVCLQKTCAHCYISHREDSASCGKIVEEEDPFSGQLYRMLRGSTNNPKTAYEAKKTAHFVYEQATQVRKILPMNGHRAWVASRNNPYVVQFDGEGNVLQKHAVNRSVMDMCFHPNGSLLLTYEGSNCVMMYKNSEESVFTKVSEASEVPTCVTAVNDGTIVVATKCINSLYDTCHLLYFDPEGNFIHTFNATTFKRITALCFNAATNKVCVADEKKGRIILVESDGRHQTYFGSDRLTIRRGGCHHHGRGFRPKTLSCDSDGSTWSYDGTSRMVHILNNSALLVALLDTNDIFGEPNHLSFAQNGELWMSDTDLLTIKIYIVEKCSNRLGHGSDQVDDDSDEECEDADNGTLTLNLSDLSPEALEQLRQDMQRGGNKGRIRVAGRRNDSQHHLLMQLHEMNKIMMQNLIGNPAMDEDTLRAVMGALHE